MDRANFTSFAKCAIEEAKTLAARAVVFVYFRSRFMGGQASIEELRQDFFDAGLGKPRADHLRHILANDHRTRRVSKDAWMLPSDRFSEVEFAYNLDACIPKDSPKRKSGIKHAVARRSGSEYIARARMRELRKLTPKDYDLTRLIKICEETNDNFSRKNYISTILLVRALLDHVPPIFGFPDFSQVANNFKTTKSIKGSFLHLENSLRQIADGHLHTSIRKKEVLPTITQANFSPDIDVLLGEIVRLSK